MTAAESTGDRRPRRRRGRRPGGADTRAALLAAARAEFADRGFDGATVRAIADRAGVDAAMVNHWFGGKEPLFTAALDFPIDPTRLIAELAPGDPEELGRAHRRDVPDRLGPHRRRPARRAHPQRGRATRSRRG